MPAPRRRIPLTNDISLLREYNTKYLRLPDYDPHQATLGEEFYSSYLLLATVGKEISNDRASGRPCTPKPAPLQLMTKGFGIPSLSHLFHQEPTFKTTHVAILKSGFLTPDNILTLHDTHPLLSHRLSACVRLRTYDFLWLSEYNPA